MYSAVVIPLGRFNEDGTPAPYVKNRLDAALVLVKTYRIRWAILSGGPTLDGGLKQVNERSIQKTGQPTLETEASLAMRYWKSECQLPSWLMVLQDTVSMETVGNVVVPVEAFIRPLRVYRILCVTSGFHVSRVQKLYDNISRDVHATVFPAEYEEAAAYDHVPRGEHFVEALCNYVNAEVTQRRSTNDHQKARITAFDFVLKRHDSKDTLYQHKDLNECISSLSWPESALEIRRTHEAPKMREWLERQWLTTSARALRQEVADKFRTGKVPDTADQNAMIEVLSQLGKLVTEGTIPPLAIKEMVNTIPARQWFTFHLHNRAPKNPLKKWRNVATVVLLSIDFCQEHHDDLIVYASKKRDDTIVGADKLELAAKQCRRLLS